MSVPRRLAAAASLAACSVLSLTGSAHAATALPALPQAVAAEQAGHWLASQVNAQGFVPSSSGATTPSLSSTAWTVLALSAARVDPAAAQRALAYLEGNVDAYVVQGGADAPGQLASLILDAEAFGVNPRAFGGTDLVARLLATEQTSGPDAGLFGTESQVANYLAGNYDQGLALAALAAAGVKGTPQTAAAIGWLVAEQCPDGGWTTPDNAQNPCDGTPASYGGPDTNSTSLALQGLAAQGASTSAVASKALAFLSNGQDADAGWSYFPSTAATPGSTDPDSTALVVQALIALGESPTGSTFVKGSANPVSALLSFQLTSGSDAGAFYFPPAPAPGDVLATYQAVPALAGLAFPWGAPAAPVTVEPVGPAGTTTSLVVSPSTATAGAEQAVTFTVTVASPSGTPTGTATVEAAGSTICTVTLAGGTGTCRPAPSQLPVGTYSVTASYPGGSSWAASRSQPQALDVATPPTSKPASGPPTQATGGQQPPVAGYVLAARDGAVYAYGRPYDGGANTLPGGPAAAITGVAVDAKTGGYWEVAADGAVYAYGAPYLGGANAVAGGLHGAIVGVAAAPDGSGYWEVAADGAVYAFGVPYLGGANAVAGGLHGTIVGVAAAPDGSGYWEVAADGTVYGCGVAGTAGPVVDPGPDTGGSPVAGIAATGSGYWEVAADGAVYAGGGAPYLGGANTVPGGPAAGRPAAVVTGIG